MPRSNLTPIDVEINGYHAVSSGSFSMGIGSVYIVKPDGSLAVHASLAGKPTEEKCRKLLEMYLEANGKRGQDGKQEEKSNPSNNG